MCHAIKSVSGKRKESKEGRNEVYIFLPELFVCVLDRSTIEDLPVGGMMNGCVPFLVLCNTNKTSKIIIISTAWREEK